MTVFFADVALYFIILLFLIVGIQLLRGKWLRLVAGNTFGDLPTKQAKICGKFVGGSLIVFALFFLLIQWNILSGILLQGLCFVLTLIAFGMIIHYLFHWVRTGE